MKKLNREMTEFFDGIYEGDKKLLVYGEGKVKARIMLIGEAPGAFEVRAGKPFVGKAGKNLDAFLEATGIAREALYITNAVKFRPVKRSAADRLVNRPPTREEVALFQPWLVREIALVAPKLIVTLGNVPLKALLGKEMSVGAMRGRFVQVGAQWYFPMYHPASLIYNPSLKAVYARDAQRLSLWNETGSVEND